MNILTIFALINVLFLLLGFWMGRHTVEKPMPGVVLPLKIGKKIDKDPYDEAMQEPQTPRMETVK